MMLNDRATLVAKGLIMRLQENGYHACSYRELAEYFNIRFCSVVETSGEKAFHYRNLRLPLGEIMNRCHTNNLPFLPAFVIRSGSQRKRFEGTPGQGFYVMLSQLEGTEEEKDRLRQREIAEAEREKCRLRSWDDWSVLTE